MTILDEVITHNDGQTGYLTLNKPEKHNAASMRMWSTIAEKLDEFEQDDATRVVVVSGSGAAFMAGADISKFAEERTNANDVVAYDAVALDTFSRLSAFPKPTIAMIDGYCIGGGMALAACCDLRFCTAASKFAVPAAKLGLGYDYRGIQLFLDVLGPTFTKEIFFTARQFDAAEVFAMGFINRILPGETLREHVSCCAQMIANNAPLTIRATKAAVVELLKDSSFRDTGKLASLMKTCFQSSDYVEGQAAFLQKRKPLFSGH